jgi:transcriptional regulator with XRE-family HTH domain
MRGHARFFKPECALDSLTFVKHSPRVSSKLIALMERVKRAAASPGKKTELAERLDVPLSQVSGWLSGVRNPSGETTLLLLEWVTAEEAKQKSPGSASNTARARTRRKVNRDEKPNIRRGKK